LGIRPNSQWRLIWGLASDARGTIWVGGTGELGRLAFDGGTYRYESFTSRLAESNRHFGQILAVAIHGDDVYFLCERTFLHWDGQHFSAIPLAYESGSIWLFSSFSGRLFVHAKHQPLCEVAGDHLVPVLDDPVLRETTVIAGIELKDKILLVTREKGIFEFRDSRIVPFKTDADDLFTRESYTDLAISVGQGLFVVGVQRRGLVFLDAAGHIQETFLEKDGLPDGALVDLRLDRAGGLWVIGDTSLTRVDPKLEAKLDQAFLIADHGGGILFSTRQANILLHAFFPGHPVASLPDVVFRWLTSPDAQKPLVICASAKGDLQIDHLASSDSRMLALLRLEQRNSSWGPKALRTLGLTPREAEVLYWITEGKTNPEISTILDTTLHTIKKHNNRLFAKLGVETRMAAARLAMSVLTAPAE
jgi:DNA-binding CsgD family transcriptional regulator